MMKSNKWLIMLLVIVAVALLSSGVGSTLASFNNPKSSTGNTLQLWIDGKLPITRIFQNSTTTGMDSYIDVAPPFINYGSLTNAQVNGKDGGNCRRALVSFDLTSLSSGSTVSSAALSLYAYTVPTVARTHDVHKITRTWTETGVNWKEYDGTNSWTNNGGDFSPTASTSLNIGLSTGWKVFSGLGTDVQNFVSNATNHGWIVKDSTEDYASDALAQYYTREYTTDITLCPKLSVTFIAPWESYQDSGRTIKRYRFTSSYTTVYMKGTGFRAGTYNVAYYDGGGSGGQKVTAASGVSVGGDGILQSQIVLTSYPAAANGTWHALVQPSSGYTAFPSDYNSASAAPDTYGLLSNDSFAVQR